MPHLGRHLIFEALGPRRPDETIEAYLRRGSPKVSIGFASLLKFWKGQYGSKETISKLERRARNNEDKVAAKRELASELEALAMEDEVAGRLEVVGILRSAARTLRDEDHQTGKGEVNE
jgi:hypothetical protein